MANGKTGSGSKLLYWVILGIVGVIIIIGQQFIKEVLFRIIGIGLIAATALGIYAWVKDRDRSPGAFAQLIGLIAVFALGLWITVNPTRFDTLINVAIGFVLIVIGVLWFIRAWKSDRSILNIAIAAVAVILGLVIATNNAATTWVVVLEGVGLLYAAVMGILTELKITR